MGHCEKHGCTHIGGCPTCDSDAVSISFEIDDDTDFDIIEDDCNLEIDNSLDYDEAIGVANPYEEYEGSFEVEPMTLKTDATERLAEHQNRMRDRWFCQGILMAMMLFDGDAGTPVETDRKHIQAAAKNLPDDEFHALLAELHDDAKHRAKSQK